MFVTALPGCGSERGSLGAEPRTAAVVSVFGLAAASVIQGDGGDAFLADRGYDVQRWVRLRS
jgi:hypothetical protein